MTNIHEAHRGRKVVTLNTSTKRRADGFPGWAAPNYAKYLLDTAAGLPGTITGVESHGSAPYTRYAVEFADGSRANGLGLGTDIQFA